MKSSGRSGIAKARPGFIRQKWQERVHPTFQRYWIAQRKNRELPRSQDFARAFDEWYKEACVVSREMHKLDGCKPTVRATVWSAILRPLDFEDPPNTTLTVTSENGDAIGYPVNPEASGLFRTLVFLKYGITFRELIRQINIEKSSAAHRKLMLVHRLYWRSLTKEQFEDLKLKFKLDHFQIITHGLDFGLGELDEYELAECLDRICPCLKKHSSSSLKKLRTGIKKACFGLILGSDLPDQTS